jgi:hypothetical protein
LNRQLGHGSAGDVDMSDKPNGNVVDYLREQFARVHVRFDKIEADLLNLKTRVSEIEGGHVRVALGLVNKRLDAMDLRLERIERRVG